MHTSLLWTGWGLIAGSLLVELFLSTVDPFWAPQHLTLLATFAWAQDAALVLGAALVAAAAVVFRLAPPDTPRQRRAAPGEAPVDWYS